MIQFRRILFPIDFSEQCCNAVPFVRAMCRRFDSELFLLHVLELPMHYYAPPEAAAWTAMSSFEPLRQGRQEQFDRFLALEDLRPKRTLLEGEPAPLIEAFAKECNADMIMLPTHGYGVFRRFLLGSVTAKVLNDLACPVWTGVHTSALLSHDPAVLKKILCAVPPNSYGQALVQWASEFAEQAKAEVRLFQAVDKSKDPEHTFDAAHRRMEQIQLNLSTNLKSSVRGGRPAHAIEAEAADWGADLVIIGRGVHHGGRLMSDEYEIIRESPCPVLSV